MKVVVTMPAFNEEKSIGTVIQMIKNTIRKTKHKYEILVVDDGSTDKTTEVAKKNGAKVISHPYRYGLAEAFKTEIESVLKRNPDIIVHIDADGQYKPEEIPKLLEPIIKGEADLVLGSRFLGEIEDMPFLKKIGNMMFSRVVSHITKVKVTDSQTGFRAFTKKLAQSIKIISKYTYTQEMIIKAVKNKFKIKEVPIYFAKRRFGESKLITNPLEYAVKAWINILRIYRDFEPLKFFGFVGLALLSVGGLIGLYVLASIIIFGFSIIYLKDLTILSMILFVIAGLQVLLFAFLADKER